MHAVLLAGGMGTRLGSFTAALPKALLPIHGVPIIERLIGELRQQGIVDYTIVTGHLDEMMQQHVGTGQRLGVNIRYFHETQPLDTAGCLGMFVPSAEPYLVINADIVTDFPFMEFARHHRRLDSRATMALCRHRVNVDFGVVECDAVGRMLRYVEKPAYDLWINMGIYCLDPLVCRYVDRDERLAMPQLFQRLREAGEVVRCYRKDCYWRDIGRPEDYAQAQKDFHRLSQRTAARLAA